VGLLSCVICSVLYCIDEKEILVRHVASCYLFLALLAATTAVRSFLLKKIFLAIYRCSVKHKYNLRSRHRTSSLSLNPTGCIWKLASSDGSLERRILPTSVSRVLECWATSRRPR
jgi:hypothetical protein